MEINLTLQKEDFQTLLFAVEDKRTATKKLIEQLQCMGTRAELIQAWKTKLTDLNVAYDALDKALSRAHRMELREKLKRQAH